MRRLLTIATVASMVVFAIACVACVYGLYGPRNWMRGTIAGGMGIGNGPGLSVFWAGDITRLGSRPTMEELQFPGVYFRRVPGPRGSVTLFLAHWFVLAVTAALPLGVFVSRWMARRGNRSPGFPVGEEPINPPAQSAEKGPAL